MKLNNNIVKKIIKEKIDVDCKTCAPRTIYSKKDGPIIIGLFENECEYALKNKSDFYFIPTVKRKADEEYELFEDEMTIWKIPYSALEGYENRNKFSKETWTKYDFSLYEDAIKVWDQDGSGIANIIHTDGETPVLGGLTERDIVCVLRGIPESNKDWINKIIIKSNNG